MTAERNVCGAQRTQVDSNLAGLGARTFPARSAGSRERGGAASLLTDVSPGWSSWPQLQPLRGEKGGKNARRGGIRAVPRVVGEHGEGGGWGGGAGGLEGSPEVATRAGRRWDPFLSMV